MSPKNYFYSYSVSEFYEYGHVNNDEAYNNYGKHLIYSSSKTTSLFINFLLAYLETIRILGC